MLFAKGCSNFLIGAALLLSFRCLWRMVYSTPKLTNVASNLSGHEGRLWASGAGRRCGAATVAGRRRPTPAAEGLKVGDGDHQARCTCRTTSSHATFSFFLSQLISQLTWDSAPCTCKQSRPPFFWRDTGDLHLRIWRLSSCFVQ